MNYELLGLLAVNVVIVAVAWGRREQMHKENTDTLKEIRTDVKRINGSVTRHATVLEHHATEIDRLRKRRGD